LRGRRAVPRDAAAAAGQHDPLAPGQWRGAVTRRRRDGHPGVGHRRARLRRAAGPACDPAPYLCGGAVRARARRPPRAGAAGGGVVIAALAIWQLQRYGAPVTASAGGGLGVDPLIVTGPALALLCGGMLGLRLVPRLSKVTERFTSPGAGLAPALGTWQVS